MACPEVHPPAYLEPKPIKNPPPIKMINVLNELNCSKQKISWGRKPLVLFNPCSCSQTIKFSDRSILFGLGMKNATMIPLMKIPNTKNKLQE